MGLTRLAAGGGFPLWLTPGVQSRSTGDGKARGVMSTYDDDDIEFAFSAGPEPVGAPRRRRLRRLESPGGRGGGERPPPPPLRTPTGLVPLARLVGLIAIAIAI